MVVGIEIVEEPIDIETPADEADIAAALADILEVAAVVAEPVDIVVAEAGLVEE